MSKTNLDINTMEPIQQMDSCFHCNDHLPSVPIVSEDKHFCCHGCATVYNLLADKNLCDFYQIDSTLNNKRVEFNAEKYAFLDLAEIQQKLIKYKDNQQARVLFYIPAIHCSSCIYLLEHMYKLNNGFLKTELNFPKKELTVVYDPNKLSLREVVEWLSRIGYDPYLSLKEMDSSPEQKSDKSTLIKLGVAAFAFGNIMLLSFPEYLGASPEASDQLDTWFRYIALLLSIPVVFYSAGSFFISAWKSLKHGILNIDAPIAIAVGVTFARSAYEVIVNQAPGYFDSMTGIVFFMLIGRYIQSRTYAALQYERDYKSYFPLAIPVWDGTSFKPTSLQDLKKNDLIRISNQELIPADGLLVKGTAFLDYSFVTGESELIEKKEGQSVYAGARHNGDFIEVQLIQPVSHSYLTSLWNKDVFSETKERRDQWLDQISNIFTWLVLIIAAATALYWGIVDSSQVLNTVTAILIIACPCTILLTASFTNGFILNAFSKMGLYLKSATYLEVLAKPDTIVLDKTGTLTNSDDFEIGYQGHHLSDEILSAIAALSARSFHPMSRILSQSLHRFSSLSCTVDDLEEKPGHGIQAFVNRHWIQIGNRSFTRAPNTNTSSSSEVNIAINGKYAGTYFIKQKYRDGLKILFERLTSLANTWIISGDTDGEKLYLEALTSGKTNIKFNQLPEQKLETICTLQEQNQKVIMIGDGLNDAGALRQADLGIAISSSINNFTPASDAILRADQLPNLYRFIALASKGRKIIASCFGYSLLYNIVGIYFAFNGLLTPLFAAIIMPASSLSIIMISWLLVKYNENQLLKSN